MIIPNEGLHSDDMTYSIYDDKGILALMGYNQAGEEVTISDTKSGMEKLYLLLQEVYVGDTRSQFS